MTRSSRVLLTTTVAFSAFFLLDELFFFTLREQIDSVVHQVGLSHILAYVLVGLPVLAGTIYLHGSKGWISALGLGLGSSAGILSGLLKGALAALVFTLPMFLGYGLLFEFNSDFSINDLLAGILAAAFFEELYFRGFLFGQFYRYTRLGFFPAVILGALLFGLVHLSQGSSLEEMVGIFMVTFIGGLLFAWVFAEWQFNLWVPIFLHLFMNLSWDLFSAGENALGGNYANLFRLMTIALAIVLTIIYKRMQQQPLEVTRASVWMRTNKGH